MESDIDPLDDKDNVLLLDIVGDAVRICERDDETESDALSLKVLLDVPELELLRDCERVPVCVELEVCDCEDVEDRVSVAVEERVVLGVRELLRVVGWVAVAETLRLVLTLGLIVWVEDET